MPTPANYPECFLSNRALNHQEFKERKITLESWPTRFMAILTTRCNLKCIHCSREVSNKLIPEEKAMQIVEFFPYLEFVNWQGGEAFMAPYFKKLLLEGARYSHLEQEVTTAGILIDEEWADVLAQAGAHLCWSIDGVTRQSYERIRFPAKFETLLQNIGFVRESYARHKKKLSMNIAACVMRTNARELPEFLEFAKEHGFDSVSFFPMGKTKDQGDDSERIFKGEHPEDIALMSHVRDLYPIMSRQAAALGVGLYWHLPMPIVGTQTTPVPQTLRPAEFSCIKPWNTLSLTAVEEGAVTPECYCHKPAGNIKEQSLKDIWNGPGMQEYRRRLRDQTMHGFCNPDCLSGFIDPRLLGRSTAS